MPLCLLGKSLLWEIWEYINDMRVTTYHSYIPPFKYKGWDVLVEEKTAWLHDAKVKVTLKVDEMTYHHMISSAICKSLNINDKDYITLIKLMGNSSYLKVSERVTKLCKSKPERTFTISANGGMLDRFMGQNCSAMKKIQQKIIEYIDCNIGIAISQNELINCLKNNM